MIAKTWAAARPGSTARLEFLSPRPGQVFHGDQAVVPFQLRLVGGRIVPTTSSKVVPNVGHVRVYLDGRLVVMSPALSGRIEVGSGIHRLEANFVASDHGPFNPPVTVSVSFAVLS